MTTKRMVVIAVIETPAALGLMPTALCWGTYAPLLQGSVPHRLQQGGLVVRGMQLRGLTIPVVNCRHKA